MIYSFSSACCSSDCRANALPPSAEKIRFDKTATCFVERESQAAAAGGSASAFSFEHFNRLLTFDFDGGVRRALCLGFAEKEAVKTDFE